ncbi:VRR-NUC domain-containing protein [Loigolactobacillus jiayinensis]|uniref:VRR-NUC domain-containing protein n=1 Tax=Loigolactobacillus jiayinensis TaxID=2486016 RepID=A0ABW1RH60_9LACO|nr:VRR-NUC domain-containing protein [Loigolactobacillus jiayinensis]
MTAEHTIQNDIRVALSAAGCTIIRTNTGTVKTEDGRLFSAGPPKGWPDLTGFRKSDGKMVLIEVKNEHGRLRKEQQRFAEMVSKLPVLYGVAQSVDDALKIIEMK